MIFKKKKKKIIWQKICLLLEISFLNFGRIFETESKAS